MDLFLGPDPGSGLVFLSTMLMSTIEIWQHSTLSTFDVPPASRYIMDTVFINFIPGTKRRAIMILERVMDSRIYQQ